MTWDQGKGVHIRGGGVFTSQRSFHNVNELGLTVFEKAMSSDFTFPSNIFG